MHDLDLSLATVFHTSKRGNWNNHDEADELAAHDGGHAELTLLVFNRYRHVDQLELVRAPNHQSEADEEMAQPRVDGEHVEDC